MQLHQKEHQQHHQQQNQTGKASQSDYTDEAACTKANRAEMNHTSAQNSGAGGLPPVPFDFVNLAIGPAERSVLHKRIAQRFQIMLDLGFIEEVEGFYRSERMRADMPSMRCVGYRQVWDYLDGKLSRDEMQERGVIATRQLAKRQLTWLRSWPNLHQLETNDTKVLAKALEIVENAAY